MSELDIPAFLRISQADRKKAWEGVPVTDPHRGGTEDAWRQREAERRELIEAEKRAKNAKGLARLKSEHVGETYDRKLKCWLPNAAKEE